MTYFLDTYALLSIYRGSKSYARFVAADFATSVFNAFEFYGKLVKMEVPGAEAALRRISRFVEIAPEDIVEGFRLSRERKGLDAIDGIGYAAARRHGLRFLTGDPNFRSMEGVEFAR